MRACSIRADFGATFSQSENLNAAQVDRPAARIRPVALATAFAGLPCVFCMTAIGLLTAPAPALAQGLAQDATPLDAIVIEGATLDGESVQASELGASTTVLTREQLEQRQIRYIGDALRSVPGLSVSRTGGFGSTTQVRMRGAEGNHTLVLIDGVEVNDTTNGEFDLADLLVDDIERIEVIRGPQSGVYGSNALGGVINIVSKSGGGPAEVRAKVEGGSYSSRAVALSARAGNEWGWGAASVSFLETEGFNIASLGGEEDGAENLNLMIRGGLEPLPGLSLTGFVRRLERKANFDELRALTIPGVQVATDNDNPIDKSTTVFAGSARLELFDGRWVQKLTGNQYQSDNQNTSATFNVENNDFRRVFAYSSTLNVAEFDWSEHALTGLIEWKDERFTPKSDFVTDSSERGRETVSVAAEYRGSFADAFFLKGAVRNDDVTAKASAGSPKSELDFTTYSISGSLKIDETGSRLHGSVGTGVVFPSLFERFGLLPNFFVGNPNLQPEESFGWDIGVEQTFAGGRYGIDVTYFQQDLVNEIQSSGATVVNLSGESEREGVEVALKAMPFDGFEVVAGYTYLDATEPDGRKEIRRPRHSGSLNIAAQFDERRGAVNFGVAYNGEMDDTVFVQTNNPFFGSGFNQRAALDEYWLASIAAQYEVIDGVSIFGRVENAFDQDYQEVFGFETANIAAYGGLRMRFGGE